jgi:putative aldouronate transport system substrate-binding protein
MSNTNVKYVQKRMSEIYVDYEAPLGAMQTISRTSENKERALMLLDLMYTDKTLYNMVMYGIEGKHYKKISDNVVEQLPKNVYKNNGNQWQFANQLLCYLTKDDDPQKWAQMATYNRNAKPFITNGFVYSGVDKFKSEYTACANVAKEFGDALKAGVSDSAKGIPQMTAKLKEAGMNKYLSDIQAELDKWVSANKKR